MTWFKGVILDVACVAIIATFVFTGASWARWFVLIYTPLMLVLKVLAVSVSRGTISRSRSHKPARTDAPEAFFHAAYGASALLLAIGRWWIMVAAWVAIWGLSVVFIRRTAPAS